MTELLIQAIRSGDLEELVWASGVFRSEMDQSYYKLLAIASGCGSLDIVSYLHQNRRDFISSFSQQEDDFGMSAVMAVAIRSGQTNVVELLLDNGLPTTLLVRINDKSSFGTSFLHVVLLYTPPQKTEQMLRLFVRFGSNVNFQDSDTGYTPLHVSVKNMQDFAVQILLEAGAIPFILNKNGQTPLDCLPTNSEIRFSYKERVRNINRLLIQGMSLEYK